MMFVAGVTALAGTGPAQEAPGLPLFGGSPPEVRIDQRAGRLLNDSREAIPSFLSAADGIAATSGRRYESRYQIFGNLFLWDLREGRLRHEIDLPCPPIGIAGLRGSGWILVAGGPVGTNQTPPYLRKIDLASGLATAEYPAGRFAERNFWKAEFLLSRDGAGAGLKVDELALYFDLDHPDKAPTPLSPGAWEDLQKRSLSAADPGDLRAPPWIRALGDTDGPLALAEGAGSAQAAVLRTDTWEPVVRLGSATPPWEGWVPSPDGAKLVSWRESGAGGLTVWDFPDFRVRWIDEPGFDPAVAPAFSPDGLRLRYLRKVPNGVVEVISRNLENGETRVSLRVAPAGRKEESGGRPRGVFSASGDRLLLESTPGNLTLLAWDREDSANPARLSLPGGLSPVSISDDGQTGWFFHTSESREFSLLLLDLARGKTKFATPVTSVGHEPTFSGSHDVRTGLDAFSYHTHGASLGYYAGDAAVVTNGALARAPGYLVNEDDPPFGRAWGVAFTRTGAEGAPLLAIYANNGRFQTWNPRSRRYAHLYEWGDFDSRLWTGEPDFTALHRRLVPSRGGRAFLPVLHGGIRVLELGVDGRSKPLADLWSLPDQGWAVILPDGTYSCAPGGERHLFFRTGNSTQSFEQFDALLNRPDLAAAALGANEGVVEAIARARRRRLATLGIDEAALRRGIAAAPSLVVLADIPLLHDEPVLAVPIVAESRAGRTLERIEVVVNGVPVESGATPAPGTSRGEFRLAIALASGPNLIQLSARDDTGARSPAVTLRVHRHGEGRPPELHLLLIGVSKYADERWNLSLAAKDAVDLERALRLRGRRFGRVRTTLLLDEGATRDSILAAREALRDSDPEDQAIVFVAGHGMLDGDYRYFFAPHDMDFGVPSARGLGFEDLESLFEGVAARQRFVMMDTCHAGAPDPVLHAAASDAAPRLADGVRAVSFRAPAAVAMAASQVRYIEELFTNLNRSRGATVLSAAGAAEFALESEEWNNGVFTYSVIDILGREEKPIRASELAHRVHETVVEMTGGLQRPNLRAMNLAVDFPVASPPAPAGGVP